MVFRHYLAAAALAVAATSGAASVTTFVGTFVPEGANSPSGAGTAHIAYDSSDNTLAFDIVFSGLSSPTTVAHVHCCTALPFTGNAGVVVEPPTLFNFPVGVTSGHYVEVIDLDDPGNVNPTFVNNPNFGNGSLAQAIAVLVANMGDGHAYFNIHTQRNPGGEIRAFLQVPEPGSLALWAGALVFGAGALRNSRRQR